MPYARNADLPAEVKNALPTAAQTVFRNVVNSALERGAAEASAFRQAWGALRRAGWRQSEGGRWVKKAAGELEKTAISYGAAHPGGTRKAAPEASWDGPGEVARAPNEAAALRRMHTWRDPEGDPEAKSSYKLPHHKADGALVLRGVRAAMGALAGARGGVAIPSGDRRGVYNHLSRHLREFDQEPPAFVERAILHEEPFAKAEMSRWLEGEAPVEFSYTFEVRKVDEERGQVFGWASVAQDDPDDPALAVDHEGDVIPPGELEKGAYAFVREARVASDSHDPETIGVGVLIESFVSTVEKQQLLGIELPVGWWVGFQVDDPELRRSIREHEHRMFSIGGFGTGEELKE